MTDLQPLTTNLEELASSIQTLHHELSARALRAVNASLTVRNWLIGHYIHEYEQHGKDRAQYGDHLIEKLAEELKQRGVRRSEARELRRYRLFFQLYPQIGESLSPEFHNLLPSKRLESLPSSSSAIRETLSPLSGTKLSGQKLSGTELLSRFSFSHICELLRCETPEKRAFYEAECVQGGWSVRELKRQIGSLLYDRSQLSLDKQKLSAQTDASVERAETSLAIRDPYIFEFLGLTPQEVMGESELEDQLLHRLQSFLLELGQGFCFEARQRRILIGDTHNFVDLVFYHRLLKCHVLVELKVARFSHENIGQLNTYVSWYDQNVRTEGDNPPVGILLCTEKDHALVEYALAGMDNSLFVSKYQLELPTREALQQQLEAERQRLEGTEL